jgi:hypothetical protein
VDHTVRPIAPPIAAVPGPTMEAVRTPHPMADRMAPAGPATKVVTTRAQPGPTITDDTSQPGAVYDDF